MDKNQIIELIKSNPQIPYETMKQQAAQAGVTSELFDEAWRESQKKHLSIKVLIPVFILVAIAIGFFGSKFLLTDFPYKISIELREVPIGDDESEFYAYLKTNIDVSTKGEKNFINYEQSLEDSVIQLSLTGTKDEEELSPYILPGTVEEWTASSFIMLELEEGENKLSISNGFSTDHYTITVSSQALDIVADKSSFSEPQSNQFERDLPIGVKYSDFETNPQAQNELTEFAIEHPIRLQNIDEPSENLQLAVIEEHFSAIQYLGNPSEKVQLAMIDSFEESDSDPSEVIELLQWIDEPSDKLIVSMIDIDPGAIQYIDNPSEEAKLTAARADPLLLQYIDDPNEEVQLAAIGSAVDIGFKTDEVLKLLEWIDEPAEETYMAIVEFDPTTIRKFKDATENIQLIAVEADYELLQHIKSPSEKVQMAAITTFVLSDSEASEITKLLEWISEPTEKVQLAVVKIYPTAIKELKDPAEAVQLIAVEADYDLIQHIDSPSEAVQITAIGTFILSDSEAPEITKLLEWISEPTENAQLAIIDIDLMAIEHIENPTNTVQLRLIKEDYKLFKYIDNPTDEAYAAVLKRNPRAILDLDAEGQAEIVKIDPFSVRFLNDQTNDVQISSVQTDPSSIRNMVDPPEAVQLEAIKGDKFAIQYIKEPTDAAIALAALTDADLVTLEQMQLEEIREDWFKFNTMRNDALLTEKVKMEVVTLNPGSIGNMYNPSEEVQLAAIAADPNTITHILKPTEKAKELAVSLNPALIVAVGGSSDSLTEEQKISVVENDGLSLRLITDPSYDVQLAAIKDNANAIQYIEDPDESLQMAAVTGYPKSIKFIKDPTEEVLAKALEIDPYVDTKYWRD